jgi:hypothetical protein
MPSAATADDFALARALQARRRWLIMPGPRLLLALMASLILHLALAAFAAIELPRAPRDQVLVTTLTRPPPPPVAAAAAPSPPPPKPRPKALPGAVTAGMPQLERDEPALPPAPTAEAPTLEPEKAQGAAPPPPPEPPPAVAEAPSQPTAPAPAEQPPARLPPKQIDLGYIALLGEQRFEVGPVTLRFQHDNGRYTLRVSGRARGLAALLYPGTFTGESIGTITAEGIRPERFIEERGSPDKRRELSFDYSERLIRIPEKEPVAMDGPAHDPLTWIVQFYFAMPKGEQASFKVASTRRIDQYTLTRAADETIELPVGEADPLTGQRPTEPVLTQVWKGSRAPDADGKGGGAAIFWLAPDWHYIPLRVKIVSAQGRSASFELTGIKTQ